MSGRRVALVGLAAVGGSLLAIIVATFWMLPNDNLAYWLAAQRLTAGEPVYVLGEAGFAPYAYHYPPPVAQVLAPLTLMIPAVAYLAVYRTLLLLTAWELAGRRFIPLLALIAFIPFAVELRFENVHVFMALGIVLGLRRWPWLFAIGAIVKVSPGLGIVYLAIQRRWRDAFIACLVGAVIVGVSFALDPSMWNAWLDSVLDRAGTTGNSLVPVPYFIRAAAGLVLTVLGGFLGQRRGELLLVAGITVANPNLALNGFAVLVAAVPIWLAGPRGIARAQHPTLPPQPNRGPV